MKRARSPARGVPRAVFATATAQATTATATAAATVRGGFVNTTASAPALPLPPGAPDVLIGEASGEAGGEAGGKPIVRRRRPAAKKHGVLVVSLYSSDNHIAFLRVGLSTPLTVALLDDEVASASGSASLSASDSARARATAGTKDRAREAAAAADAAAIVLQPPPRVSVQLKGDCAECAELDAFLTSDRAAGLPYTTIRVGARASASVDHHCVSVTWPTLRGALPDAAISRLKLPAGSAPMTVLSLKELKKALAPPKTKRLLHFQSAAVKLVEARVARGDPPRVIFLKVSMGSGKTKLAATFLEVLPPLDTAEAWVVGPNTILGAWARELQCCTKQPRGTTTEFHVVGYAEFHRICHDNPRAVEGATVIVDEAHYYRNLTAPMRHDIECLRAAARVVLLTGDGARFVSAQWHPTRTYDTKQMKWVETGFWKLARVSVDGREVVFGVQKVPFAPIAYRLPS